MRRTDVVAAGGSDGHRREMEKAGGVLVADFHFKIRLIDSRQARVIPMGVAKGTGSPKW